MSAAASRFVASREAKAAKEAEHRRRWVTLRCLACSWVWHVDTARASADAARQHHRAECPGRPKKLDRVARMREMRHQGLSWDVVAERLGITVAAARSAWADAERAP